MNDKIKTTETGIWPVLALRGMPVFPYSVIHFDVGRDISIKAIQKAMDNDKEILILAQLDPAIEMPQEEDFLLV